MAPPAARFPPRPTAHHWDLRLSHADAFECLGHVLTMPDRERNARKVSPGDVTLDTQAARSGGVGVGSERGYESARHVVER